MPQSHAKLAVTNLWKVFGTHPGQILEPEWRDKSRKEIQDETGQVIALRDVTFDVNEGETFVVMGLSGSGKSTLARCLLRLIQPTKGEIAFDGEDIMQYSHRQLIDFRRHKTGMVFQRFGLMPHRSARDNVGWALEIQGLDKTIRDDRARELLEMVGLSGWENSYPYQLSGGMQQRVGLARALAADPEILVMDEPFSALDPLIRREMQDELIRLQYQINKTIVFITHDLDEALKVGSRIAIMRDGEIIQSGTSEEIIMNPIDEYVGEFTKSVRKADIQSLSSIMNPPRTRLYAWQGPRLALHEMRGAEAEFAFVVDSSEQLLGIVTLDAARSAIDAVDNVSGIVEKTPMVLSADELVATLITKLLDYDWNLMAIPVVDSEGKLVGELHRTTVQSIVADLTLFDQKDLPNQKN